MMILAEIADKVPSLAEIAAIAITVAIVAVLLGLIRKWMVLLTLPVVVLGNWVAISELQDEWFGGAAVAEFGMDYIHFCFAVWNVPYVIALILILALVQGKRGAPRGSVVGVHHGSRVV